MSSDQIKYTQQGIFSGRAELQPTQSQATYPTFPGGYQYGAAPVPAAPTNSSDNKTEKKGKDDDYEPGSLPVEHLNLEFDACFHEHKSMQTWPPLHLVTGMLYRYTKLLVYHFLVILIGFIFTFIWAIINGINSFIHVWIWGPTLKFIQVWIFALAPVITMPLRAILTPLVDAQARIFRQIRIQANLTGPIAKAFAGQDRVQQTTSL